DEDVELNLGPVANVVVEAKLMDFKTEQYRFDTRGNISGWDEIRTFDVEVKKSGYRQVHTRLGAEVKQEVRVCSADLPGRKTGGLETDLAIGTTGPRRSKSIPASSARQRNIAMDLGQVTDICARKRQS
ncbi:MAG: hypothetical protein AMJ75_08500, partial [Phycisphaerae bacterium SM1_79]